MDPKLQQSIDYIREKTALNPGLGIILGSGLGSFADQLEGKIKIPTESIPHYPRSTVEGHYGYLVFGSWKEKPLIAVQGRTHFYEGYEIEKVTYVVRILAALGIKKLIVTNASGGVNPALKPGDLMLITDQINNMFENPLRGPLRYGGSRFPDMSTPYDPVFREMALKVAKSMEIPLKQGVLAVTTGPSYETAAEVRMLRTLGGDAVCMSTVPEVIVGVQMGLRILGISCITNLATGLSEKPLSHHEVKTVANQIQKTFIRLIEGIVGEISRNI